MREEEETEKSMVVFLKSYPQVSETFQFMQIKVQKAYCFSTKSKSDKSL